MHNKPLKEVAIKFAKKHIIFVLYNKKNVPSTIK